MKYPPAEIVAALICAPLFVLCLLVLAPVFFFAGLAPRPGNRRRCTTTRLLLQNGGLQ
jgi:hypothetical protein